MTWKGEKHDDQAHPAGRPVSTFAGHTLYSHLVIASGQSLVFIAGQLARDSEGRVVGKGDMAAQIRQVGENLRIALAAAGCGLKDIVKTTTYVTDIEEFFKHPEVRNEIFGQALPTSTTVEVRRLSHPDLMVEVEAMAVMDR
jgi:enamine deaminase RidA (YjgF/YER057c/UK114 family)